MKSLKLIQFFVLVLTLSLGVIGCKKRPTSLTPLPGRGAGQVGDAKPSGPVVPTDARPINLDTGGGAGTGSPISSTPFTTPTQPVVSIPESGLANSDKDFSSYPQDRERFKAQTVYFDFDKSTVKPGEIGKLETVASEMKGMAGKALRIEGHCDERGTEEYNRALGERRAQAVREKLVSLGLNADMIVTISFGEDQSADPGHNEAAWSKNRRGEIILLTPPGGAAAP